VTKASPGRHGISLRPDHFDRVLREGLAADVVELLSEAFLSARGGARHALIERLASEMPISLHGTSLSIGSVDPLRRDYLQALGSLADRVGAAYVSDHLAWASYGGGELDLCPLPYTDEALAHVVARVDEVQDMLGRQLLLENPSSYVAFRHSTMTEWEFLANVADETGCGILLDVNNVYVCSRNHRFSALEYLAGLPAERVLQIHLAGHLDLGDIVVDTHEGPVPHPVWDIYRAAVGRFGCVPTIVEWDSGVPALDTLLAESRRAAAIEQELLG
jgi:hypothetical protein